MKEKIKLRVKKVSHAVALLSAELVFLFIAFFVSLAVLIVVIRNIFYHKEYSPDNKVFNYLLPHVTDRNTFIMQCFTVLGSHKFLIPAFLLLLAWYFFSRKNKWYFIKLLVVAVSNLGLMFGLKFLFNRPRPLIPLLKEVPGLSFPSGHAFMSLTFFGLLIYIIYRDVASKWLKWGAIIILILIIFMVGLSRVYLRLHYASDVIAGYCFGILSLIILLWMLRRLEKFNAKKIPYHLNVTKTGTDSALRKLN
jgi:undecaprenyl-diphosphatase